MSATRCWTSGSLLNVPEEQLDAAHAQQAFDQLASRCGATAACARSYRPAADLATILARLSAHPARVSLPGPDGQRQTITVTGPQLHRLRFDTELSSIQTAVSLPAALHALALGQWSYVISEFGLTAGDLHTAAPSHCRPSPSAAATRGPP